jgi:hypothetical protein
MGVFVAHADLGFCRDRTNQNANPNAKAITSQQIGLNTVTSISTAKNCAESGRMAWTCRYRHTFSKNANKNAEEKITNSSDYRK